MSYVSSKISDTKFFQKHYTVFRVFKDYSEDFQWYFEIVILINECLTQFYLKILQFINFYYEKTKKFPKNS